MLTVTPIKTNGSSWLKYLIKVSFFYVFLNRYYRVITRYASYHQENRPHMRKAC
jgi:hypothetical protein